MRGQSSHHDCSTNTARAIWPCNQGRSVFSISNIRLICFGITLLAALSNVSFAQDEFREAEEILNEQRVMPGQGNQKVVRDVRIVGNRNVSRNEILSRLKTRPERYYDSDLVQADAHELMLLRKFRDVRTYVRETEDGVVVTYEVLEKPIIRKINYFGNRSITDRTLKKNSGIKEGDALDLYSIRIAKQRIEDFYRQKGFQRTEVDILPNEDGNEEEVTFMIMEDHAQRIHDVKFVGCQFVSAARLEALVKSKPGKFAPVYRTKYVEENLDLDKVKLVNYYRNFGYLNAVVDTEVTYNDDHSLVDITYVIREGVRYKIREISVAGNKIYTNEQLLGLTEVRGDEFYEGGRLQADVNTLKDLYGSNGYIEADVNAETIFQDEPGYVDIVLKVSEGEQYRVGRINVHIGGEFGITRQSVVLSRLDMRPGDIIDTRKIRDSERRLAASGLFETNPQMGAAPKLDIKPTKDPFGIEKARMARNNSNNPNVRFQSPDGPEVKEADIDVYVKFLE